MNQEIAKQEQILAQLPAEQRLGFFDQNISTTKLYLFILKNSLNQLSQLTDSEDHVDSLKKFDDILKIVQDTKKHVDSQNKNLDQDDFAHLMDNLRE